MSEAEQLLLERYLNEVAEIPPLTPGEERRLARARSAGGEVATEAARSLVRSNLHLVISIAEAYIHPKMGLLDLIQEGNLGLMHAVDDFGPEHHEPFAALAGPRIARAIEDGIASW